MKIALALAAGLFCASLAALPAAAMPLAPGVAAPAPIELAANGCGRGWTVNRRGHCVPMRRHYRGPRVHVPRVYIPRVLRHRAAPHYRANMRDRRQGCQYIRTPGGTRYVCK